MLRKIILYFIVIAALFATLFFTIVFYATYSEGNRSGELIKFSNKGYVFKTWEGELSQGLSGNKIFAFSVLDENQEIITKLQEMQGRYVKVTYVERYKTFPWWGETTYFVTAVQEEKSPIFSK